MDEVETVDWRASFLFPKLDFELPKSVVVLFLSPVLKGPAALIGDASRELLELLELLINFFLLSCLIESGDFRAFLLAELKLDFELAKSAFQFNSVLIAPLVAPTVLFWLTGDASRELLELLELLAISLEPRLLFLSLLREENELDGDLDALVTTTLIGSFFSTLIGSLST